MYWRQKGNSPRREGIPATSTCSGTEQPGPAALGNLAKTYSVPARSVPYVRSLVDRSTWPAQIRALGNDMDRGFTHPPSRQSEPSSFRRPESPYSERVLGLTIMPRTKSSHLGKRCC